MLLAFLAFSNISFAITPASQVESGISGYIGTDGKPLANGYLYHYEDNGSTTVKTLWSDKNKTVTLPNPIRLSAAGLPTNGVNPVTVFGDGRYHFIIKNSAGTTIWDKAGLVYQGAVNTDLLFTDVKGTYGTDTAAIISALTDAGTTTPKTLLFRDTTFTLAQNITIPSNITLMFINGGFLSVSLGTVVNHLGMIDAGNQYIIGGLGAFTYSNTKNPIQYAKWFNGSEGTVKFNAVTLNTVEATGQGTFDANVVVQGNLTVYGSINAVISGIVSSSVYSLDSDKLDAQQGSYYQNADNINSGNINAARVVGSYTGITKVGTLPSLNVMDYVQATRFLGDVNGLNVTANNLAGTLQTASQPNITSVGTLTGLTIVGGLNVGTAIGAGTGQVRTSGSIVSYKTNTSLVGILDDTGSYDYAYLTNSGGTGGLYFGNGVSGADTNIRRTTSNVLKTDDRLDVALDLNVSGNTRIDGTLTAVGTVTVPTLNATHTDASTSAGLHIGNNTGGDVAIFGAGGATGTTLYGGTNINGTTQINNNLTVTGDIYTESLTNYESTSTITGWSSYTYKVIRYRRVGKLIFVYYYIKGTSNSVETKFTLPYVCNSNINIFSPCSAENNSAITSNVVARMSADSALVTFQPDLNNLNWTNSGTKSVNGQFFYETN